MARRRRKPSFFKVLVDDFYNKLKIPPCFYVHFAGDVPRKSRLQTTAGTWNVNVEMVNDGFFFQKGWKKFVHENGLKLCEFLVFRYAGNSKFSVEIYGKNSCKKEFVKAVKENDRSIEEGRGNASHGNRNVDGNITGQATRAIKEEEMDIESDASLDMEEPEPQEDHLSEEDSEIGVPGELGPIEHLYTRPAENTSVAARALKAAKKYSPNHPFFRTVLKKAYLEGGTLLLPKSFWSSYIGRNGFIKLQDSKKRWHVKCTYRHRAARLLVGWKDFVKHHALIVGDVCVFELINRDDVVLKVSIFRC